MKFLKLHVIRHNSQGANLKETIVVNTDTITYCYLDEEELPSHFRVVGDPSVFHLEDRNEKYSLKNLMGQ